MVNVSSLLILIAAFFQISYEKKQTERQTKPNADDNQPYSRDYRRRSKTNSKNPKTCVFHLCSVRMESTTDKVETVSINHTF